MSGTFPLPHNRGRAQGPRAQPHARVLAEEAPRGPAGQRRWDRVRAACAHSWRRHQTLRSCLCFRVCVRTSLLQRQDRGLQGLSLPATPSVRRLLSAPPPLTGKTVTAWSLGFRSADGADGTSRTCAPTPAPTPAASAAHGPHAPRGPWNPALLGAGPPGAPGDQAHQTAFRSILLGTQFDFRRTSNLQPVAFPGHVYPRSLLPGLLGRGLRLTPGRQKRRRGG